MLMGHLHLGACEKVPLISSAVGKCQSISGVLFGQLQKQESREGRGSVFTGVKGRGLDTI